MMAMSNKLPDQEPGEIEALLPWHAAGTLSARDARRVEDALAHDVDLARQYEVIREEYAETIALNESLGAPSVRAMQKLFAAIDAEPVRKDTSKSISFGSRLTSWFGGLSPRTLMAGTAIGCLTIMLQAGVIGSIVMQREEGGIRPLSQDAAAPKSAPTAAPSVAPAPAPAVRSAPAITTRSMQSSAPAAEAGVGGPMRLDVLFAPTARMSDITALLDTYQGTIVGSDKSGLFRLQFASGALTDGQRASLIRRLESEKIVSMATVPAR